MLLYPLNTRSARTWILDLSGPLTAPDLPCVYALVVPPGVYIGATRHLAARVRQHLSRARRAGRRGKETAAKSAAAAVLAPVVAGRSGLLVIRLEAAAPGDAQALRRLELCWMLVAAREELPVKRHRGPRLQWSGDPGELRAAFRLARHRRWPTLWIRALKALCENRALPERPPRRPAPAPSPKPGGPGGNGMAGRPR